MEVRFHGPHVSRVPWPDLTLHMTRTLGAHPHTPRTNKDSLFWPQRSHNANPASLSWWVTDSGKPVPTGPSQWALHPSPPGSDELTPRRLGAAFRTQSPRVPTGSLPGAAEEGRGDWEGGHKKRH